MPQVTLALIPNRISAIVDSRACTKDQIVLQPSSEEDFAKKTTGFAHIEWRSIAEVIQYLGAVARNQNNDYVPSWNSSKSPKPQSIFKIQSGQGITGRIKVFYNGHDYSVGQGYDDSSHQSDRDRGDQSLQALALLNELISIAKISGSLPVTQPVQVLP